MRVHLVDPAAYTPPYDRALASALARAGAEVSLITSAFTYGDVPDAPGVDVVEAFYRWAPARGRRFARLAQHGPDMLRYRRARRGRRALPVAAGAAGRRVVAAPPASRGC